MTQILEGTSQKKRKKRACRTQGDQSLEISLLPYFPIQAARLKQGLSVEEVARRLCLRPEVVEALEEERWLSFSYSAAYVLGFIQAYGKLIEFEVEEVLARFRAFQEKETLIELKSAHSPKEVLTPHKPTTFLFGLSLMGSVSMAFCLTPFLQFNSQLDIRACLEESQQPLQKRVGQPQLPEETLQKKEGSSFKGSPLERWWEKSAIPRFQGDSLK